MVIFQWLAKNIKKRCIVSKYFTVAAMSILLFVLSQGFLFASDSNDGYIRLILNQRDGSFSIYYLLDTDKMQYVSLLYDKDPSTSFISIKEDDNVYRLGQSRDFRIRLERQSGHPALVFESSTLLVTQIFAPVRTPNSPYVNGIKMTVNVFNKGMKHSFVGLRMLFDTYLGEPRGRVPFITNTQLIRNERVIDSTKGEMFWISQGRNISLMGSIVDPSNTEDSDNLTNVPTRLPDYVHFANWKRLADSQWALNYSEERSFTFAPYSVGDSAVCYFFEPVLLESRGTLSFSVFLTTDDIGWYRSSHPIITPRPPFPAPEQEPLPPVPPPILVPVLPGGVPAPVPSISESSESEPQVIEESIDTETESHIPARITVIEEPVIDNDELQRLYDLQETLNRFLNGEIDLNEESLFDIERSINEIRSGQ